MARPVTFASDVIDTARGLSPRAGFLMAAGLVCLGSSYFMADPLTRGTATMAGITFCALVVLIRGLVAAGRLGDRWTEGRLGHLVGLDATPCFTTDNVGQISFLNRAAVDRFHATEGTALVATLSDHFASPASVLYRLQSRAANTGAAREDVVTRRGHMRLSVHRLSSGRFMWRMEEFSERGASGRGADGLSLPMLVSNKSGVVLYSNEAMRRLIGSRPKRLDRVFTTTSFRSGEEVEVTSANGPVRAVLAEVEGPGERREIYLLPVPDHPENEAKLADFEHVPVAILKFRPDGGLWAANRAARDLLGIDAEAAPKFAEMFEGLGRSLSDWFGDVLSERLPGGAEVLRLRQTDSEAFFQVALRRVVEAGRPGIVAILQDATALKTLEAQFVQSQKMQAIGQLAGGIAHDFNNLLTAISGHCDLLLLRHDPADPDYADLVQVHQNANRAAGLVGQLLAFSRKQTLKPERIDVRDVLADLTHLLNRLVGERVKLTLAHAPDLGQIRADKRQLEQVLMNLVVNARDSMPEGGRIRIETEALVLQEEMRRNRALLPAGDYSVIRVQDTGCGIPEDRIDKIFEPFYTTKGVGEGTGLGLSMVYGIVKQSGGFVFVDSVPGQGSVFHLYFPVHEALADDMAAAPLPGPERPLARQGEGVVLLVEDEAPVRAFASRALRMRGYTVLEAENAEEALKTLADPKLEVDIFVTDVVMPGMDGPSWVRQALHDRPNVKVVFVSGYSEDSVTEGSAKIPNSVFLPKPFSLNDLTATVQGQLH